MTKQTEGLIVGRYQIVKEIARGGFGVTYLAQDTLSSNSPCVIKKLNPQSADIETAKILFQREAHVLNHLQRTQQIPKFLNYFEEGDNYYLVQEYIQGKSLDKLLDRRWPNQKVIHFLQEILFILKSLHQINIIHRDIKPSNVIRRDEDQQFILIDFGSVKQLDPKYSYSKAGQPLPTHTMIGTPGYAPTEQMDGRPSFNSDIYGLGITAIHLLTGIHPRDLKRDEQDNVIFPKGIDTNNKLCEILTKMVYFSTERRYQTVDEVIEHINEITIQPNGALRNWTGNLAVTRIEPQFSISRHERTLAPLQRSYKYSYIIIGVLALSFTIIGIEFFIYPFIRPAYYLYRGESLIKSRKPEAASEEFQNFIDLKPTAGDGWRGKGDALMILGRYSSALAFYQKALSLEPDNLKILNNTGRALYKLGQSKEALETYEKVLQLNPNADDLAEAWSGKGIAHIGLRQYQEASKAFEELKQLRPDKPNVWYETGLAVEQLQGPQAARMYYRDALDAYEDFLKKNGKDPISLTVKGDTLQKLNRYEEALNSYREALKIDENFYEALLGKGNTLLTLQKPQDAFWALDRASKIRPQQNPQVWFTRGLLLTREFGKHEEAIKSFDQAIKLDNQYYDAWQGKGLALSDLKRYEAALAALNKAKDLAPNNALIWANIWSVLQELGKTQEAEQAYQKAIELGFPAEELEKSRKTP
ncbi:serine/threonine protein kinase [Scytonema hofmannii PCC 7110]|uniref:Serine/threonine protein kinase n=1 Tax=Scytonema hofmannii PCC 7110 TaxID=128403 RepID=A0A139WT34_9CYAN|nr:serine/threonine-protein kinase [Scytonema hofmannii]KYC35573.1 serine/threonine protein kinase [Scytonema hofmannii PCC 7110]